MFTEIKNGKWSYMLLMAMASLALAALATLFTARSSNDVGKNANDENGKAITGRYMQNSESTLRFIN